MELKLPMGATCMPVGHGEDAGLLAGVHVVDGDVLLTGLLVVHHGVAVAEGASLHILPAQPHVVPCTMPRHASPRHSQDTPRSQDAAEQHKACI